MKTQNLFGTMLAASLALSMLAGCQTPNPLGNNALATGDNLAQGGANFVGNGVVSAGAGNLTGAAATNPTTSADAAAMQADEQDAEGYDAVGGQADAGASMYAVMDVNASASAAATASAAPAATPSATPSASPSATPSASASAAPAVMPVLPSAAPSAKVSARKAKIAEIKKLRAEIRKLIAERRARLRAKEAQHLAQNEQAAIRNAYRAAKWHDNGDGTETKDVTVNLTRTQNGKTFTRDMHLVRTVDTSDMTLVDGTVDISETFPAGGTHTVHWEKALQADGSYDVVFKNDRVWADKAKSERTAVWDKVVDANGNVTGTGVITWFKNGQQVSQTTITLGGTSDAPTTIAPSTTGTPPAAPSPDDNAPATGTASPAPSASPAS